MTTETPRLGRGLGLRWVRLAPQWGAARAPVGRRGVWARRTDRW